MIGEMSRGLVQRDLLRIGWMLGRLTSTYDGCGGPWGSVCGLLWDGEVVGWWCLSLGLLVSFLDGLVGWLVECDGWQFCNLFISIQ